MARLLNRCMTGRVTSGGSVLGALIGVLVLLAGCTTTYQNPRPKSATLTFSVNGVEQWTVHETYQYPENSETEHETNPEK